LNHKSSKLEPTTLPPYDQFAQACAKGLSVVYPFKSTDVPDPNGWKLSPGWPPSYPALGRMRSLLTIEDAFRKRPRRVLEVAAGGGGLAASLAFRGCEVVINDLRGDYLREAIKEYSSGDKLQVVEGNLFELVPEQLGKFDLVIACEVIEHVAHPPEFLLHLKSFLEPEGKILLTTPNGSHLRNKLPTYSQVPDFNALESRQFLPDADGHLFLLTPQEIYELAASVGLEIEQLNLWGTPFLSGHCWLRHLAGRHCTKAAYQAERLTQHLPLFLRQRLCVELTAILKVGKV
jgi:2-polyprenyl-6-hydroxyphenyl methylase/3-demethylubiquinone-9 3-methyltransferase